MVDYADPGLPRFTLSTHSVDIAALIISYQSAADLPGLITSLRNEADGIRMRVIIVDNSSSDRSVEISNAQGDVVVVRAGGNLGYAAAINIGIAHAGDATQILVLNPDLIVEAGAVSILRRRLRTSGAAVVIPKILDNNGDLFRSLRREPSLARILGDTLFGSRLPRRPGWLSESVRSLSAYSSAGQVAWATGAAMLIDRCAWDVVGQWDERFFLYSEETDFLRRIRLSGRSVWYEPKAVVRHRQGGSGTSPELVALLMVNRVRYMMKHHPRSAGIYRAVLVVHEELRRHDISHDLARRALRSRRLWASLPTAERESVSATPSLPVSVVVLATDRRSSIDRCLRCLQSADDAKVMEVVLVCEESTSLPATIPRFGGGLKIVRVDGVTRIAALAAGDLAATQPARIYIDADARFRAETIAAMTRALVAGMGAVRPTVEFELTSVSSVARAFLRARMRMPSATQHLWGVGIYGLSRDVRERLGGSILGENIRQVVPPSRARQFADVVTVNALPRTGAELLTILGSTTQCLHDDPILRFVGSSFSAGELARTVVGPRSALDASVMVVVRILARMVSVGSRVTLSRARNKERRISSSGV